MSYLTRVGLAYPVAARSAVSDCFTARTLRPCQPAERMRLLGRRIHHTGVEYGLVVMIRLWLPPVRYAHPRMLQQMVDCARSLWRPPGYADPPGFTIPAFRVVHCP